MRSAPKSALRALGLSVSVALAYRAQFELGREMLLYGSSILGGAMVLFGILARSPCARAPLRFRPGAPLPSRPLLHGRSAAWLFIAIVSYGLSIERFYRGGEDLQVRLLWLAAIVALALSQWRSRPATPQKRATRQERPYLLGLGIVLLVALFLRTYRLSTLPLYLDGDFASHGLQARALATGAAANLFRLGWAEIPILAFTPSAVTMSLFGTGLIGLNAAGVIEGLLMIMGGYLLGRDLYQERVGLIASSLLAISYVHIHFSRSSEYIDPAFFVTFGVYCFLLGLRRGSEFALVASSLFCTLAFLSYYSGRIVLPLIPTILLWFLLTRRCWVVLNWRALLLWCFGCLVVLGPMLVVFLENRYGLTARTNAVIIFNPGVMRHSLSKYGADSVAEVLWEQAKRTLLMFNVYWDTSTQGGLRAPFLDKMTAPLFALGVASALCRPRCAGSEVLLSWLGLTLVFGCFLTVNPPFWVRVVGAIVPACILAAVAMNHLYETAVRLVPAPGRRHCRRIAATMLALFITVVGWKNWTFYVKEKGTWASPRTRIARFLARHPVSEKILLVRDPFGYRDREFEFLAPGRLKGEISPRDVSAGQLPMDDAPLTLVLTTNHARLLEDLRRRYPAGHLEIFPDNDPQNVSFYTYTIPG